MWYIDDPQTVQAFGMFDRQYPGNQRAKVMRDQVDLFIFQCVDQAQDIFCQGLNTIALYPFWLVAQVVSTLIRDNDSTACLDEPRQLPDSATPIFRKAV